MLGANKAAGVASAVFLTLLSSTGTANESWIQASAEAVYVHDDNLTQAMLSRDIVEDDGLIASATLSHDFAFSQKKMMGVHAFFETRQWDLVDTLNENHAGGRVDFRMVPEISYTAPIFQFALEARAIDSDSDIRSADQFRAQALVTRRTTEEITLTMGLSREWTNSDGLVFDTQRTRIFVHGDVALPENYGVYSSYSFMRGDFTSSAQQTLCDGSLAGGILDLVTEATAVEPDTALDDALCGNWLAYRIDADAHVFKLGLRKGFNHRFSADLSSSWVDVQSDGDVEYQRNIINAALLMSF